MEVDHMVETLATESDKRWHQPRLAIFDAPSPVQARLSETHSWPYTARHKSGGLWRMRCQWAWTDDEVKLIEVHSATAYTAVIVDADVPAGGSTEDLQQRLGAAVTSGQVLPPTWTTISAGGGLHVLWALAAPVLRHPAASPAPLAVTARISEWCRQALDGDCSYTGLVTYRPGQTERTCWGPVGGYSLDELRSVIPAGWRRPRRATTGIGRNCDLFAAGCVWAGRRSNVELPVVDELLAWNAAHNSPPLGRSEVEATARSVERYRARWRAAGWITPEFAGRQAARGRAAGRARRDHNVGRDDQIMAAAAAGESTTVIAERHGLSRRQIERMMEGTLWAALSRQSRDDEIRQAHSRGDPLDEIAAKHDLSTGWVRRIIHSRTKAEIAAMHQAIIDSDQSTMDLAAQYGLSRRRVQQIKAQNAAT